ncbi:hypothetical protein V1525DRAFT_448663 [Lipomyces kononenkoae]|uniref:Uncharacterized protein n=1 Tax=Lipomyces kononenkoae TaxID=34357 RepID=A0ACC3T6R4_LIPKO
MRPEENPAVDYYAVLELESTACTAEEIKKAYRKLALLYHPDKNNGQDESAEKFKAIVEANDILGDPVKRQIYDRARQNAIPRSTQGTPYTRHYADPSIYTNKSTPKGTWSWNNSQKERYGWSSTPSSGYYYTYGRQKNTSSTPNGKSQSARSAANQYAESPRKPSAYEYRNRNSNPGTSTNNNRNNAKPNQTNSFPFPRAPTATKTTTNSPNASSAQSNPTTPRTWSSSKTAYSMRTGERTYAPTPQKTTDSATTSEPNLDSEMPAPKRAETSFAEDPSSTSSSSSSTSTPTSAGGFKNSNGQNTNKGSDQQSASAFYTTGSGLKFSSPNFDFTARPTARPKVFKAATPTGFHFGVRTKGFSNSWNANGNGTNSSPTPSPRGSKDDPVDVDSDEDVYMYPDSTIPKPFQEKVNHSSDANKDDAGGHNDAKKLPRTHFVADMWNNAFSKENPFLFDVWQGSKIPTSVRKTKTRPTVTNTRPNSAESPRPTVKQEDDVSKGQRPQSAEAEAPRPPSQSSASQDASESQPPSTPSPKKRDRQRLKSAMKSRAPLGASSFDDLGLFKTVPPFTQGNGEFKMDDLKKTFPINPENVDVPGAATKTTSVESDIPMDSPRSPAEPRSPRISPATNADFANVASQPLPFDRDTPIFTSHQQQTPTAIDFHDSRAVFDIEPPVAPIPPINTISPTETEMMDYWQKVLVYQQQWNDYQLKMTLYLNERHHADSQNSMQILSNSGNLDRYIKALQQDDRVRLRWNEALNVHKRVMINLLAVRRIVEGW